MSIFRKSKQVVLIVILTLFAGFAASEPIEPEILELEDNFNNTYNIPEDYESNQKLVFGEGETLEVCASKVKHSESADLSYGFGTSADSDSPCFERELTPENYSKSFRVLITVVDNSLPHNPSDFIQFQYRNTELATVEASENQQTTDYDHILVEREDYNSIQEQNQRLRDENEDLTSQLESKNNTIESLENEIEELEKELAESRKGLKSWINKLF